MTTTPTPIPQRPAPCDACGQAAFDAYDTMTDEFDALVTVIQAQRRSMMDGSDHDNPFYCVDDHAPGWGRIALLARVLERQAVALRECYDGLT